MFWIAIVNNKKNTKPLEHYINILFPIILTMIDGFEKELEKEFPSDLIEKQMHIEYQKR